MTVPSISDLTALIGQNVRVSYHGSERDFTIVGSLVGVPTRVDLTYTSGDMELSYSDLIDVEATTDDVTDPTPI